jgi:hypothetical protein
MTHRVLIKEGLQQPIPATKITVLHQWVAKAPAPPTSREHDDYGATPWYAWSRASSVALLQAKKMRIKN